jgi:hypothetical protein
MVMHRPPLTPAAVLAASLLIWLNTGWTYAVTPEALAEARALLERGQAGSAVTLLEETLAITAGDRQGPLIDLLRQAYAAAAREAKARGRTDEAELYRDNLEILKRNYPVVPPSPAAEAPPTRPSPAPSPLPITPSPEASVPDVADRLPQKPPEAPLDVTSPPKPRPVLAPAVDLSAADSAFRAQRYDEAGQLYATLEQERRLPPARREHWAYCRWVDVVRRINARPSTPQEWAEIDAEIQRIRALSPNNWYGEYLRNRAAERPDNVPAGKKKAIVFRGSAPEDPPPKVAPSLKPPANRVSPGRGTGSAVEGPREPQKAANGPVQWQVRETPSFRILHVDPELAERAAEAAESARDVHLRRWTGAAPKGPWTPKCELYLYPTALIFSQMTGQPEESPGFSTMGMNGGRIIARRVNLRVDHPNLLRAILPHEITHVVLADLFPHQQIPRWADEGMAVLSEPASEQHLRAADLNDPLSTGQLYKLDQLMTMDYPEGRYWGLYYAQSVSLTRFLVEQGTPTQFVQFVQRAQQNGPENELRRVYNIDGFADLQTRWMAYAKTRSADTAAAVTRTNPATSPTSR